MSAADSAMEGGAPATPQPPTPRTVRARGSSPLHTRSRPAHFSTVRAGFRSTIIFLTVCTHRRRPLLANEAASALITEAWRKADVWCVGRYVILPDHIHLFCAPNSDPPESLKKWVSFWRNYVTRNWLNRGQVPHLATGLLGSPATKRGIIYGKMAVREKQSGPPRTGHKI
jgi:hypothetical protein